MHCPTETKGLLAGLALLLAQGAYAERALTLGEYSDEVRAQVVAKIQEALGADGHAAEVAGTVTFARDGQFFLQKDGDGMKVLAKGLSSLPKAGEDISVEGTPSLDGGRVVFVAKRWTPRGAGPLPAARAVTMDDLVEPGGAEKPSVNGLRGTVEGRAIGLTENGFALSVDGVPVNVMLPDLPDFLSDCELTHPMVRVTGVVEQVLDQSALFGAPGYVMGVKVNVVSPDDIVLQSDAAYLARRHERLVSHVGVSLIAALVLAILVFAFVYLRQRRRIYGDRKVMAERKRMADDLHDTIEQHLVGAKMLLGLGRAKEAQDVLVRAKSEIRDIVWGLKNDDMMRLSPADMLRRFAHDETTKGIYRVDTRLEGLPTSMDAAAMRDLSLIVREAIGNAVKHGGAKKIAISSDPMPGGGWQLRISNDGTPFDPASAPGAAEGHFGLEGMRQRARRIKAELTIARRKDGMVVTLQAR